MSLLQPSLFWVSLCQSPQLAPQHFWRDLAVSLTTLHHIRCTVCTLSHLPSIFSGLLAIMHCNIVSVMKDRAGSLCVFNFGDAMYRNWHVGCRWGVQGCSWGVRTRDEGSSAGNISCQASGSGARPFAAKPHLPRSAARYISYSF